MKVLQVMEIIEYKNIKIIKFWHKNKNVIELQKYFLKFGWELKPGRIVILNLSKILFLILLKNRLLDLENGRLTRSLLLKEIVWFKPGEIWVLRRRTHFELISDGYSEFEIDWMDYKCNERGSRGLQLIRFKILLKVHLRVLVVKSIKILLNIYTIYI